MTATATMSRTRVLNELRGMVGRYVRVAVGPPFGAVVMFGRLGQHPEDRSAFYLGDEDVWTGTFKVPRAPVRGGWHQGFLMLHAGALTIGVELVQGEDD